MALKNWLIAPQSRLGAGGLLAFLVISSIITPLSLDTYTPAVPHMAEYFNTTASVVNLTLVGYYLFFALGMLVMGPVSDKRGRKPVLLAGAALYAIGSATCAASPSIEALIAARIIQAIGAGGISAVGTAVVKDSFELNYREKILSIIQVLFVVGPAAAPIIGASILQVADWRAIFWTLTAIAVACFLMLLAFDETLPRDERTQGSLGHTFAQLGVVAKNPGFTAFLIIGSAFEVPFMAYIAAGSYMYVDFFGTSAFEYSLYFAVAALVCAAGPFIWLMASKRVTIRRFTTCAYALATLTGVALLAFGTLSPQALCACFIAFAIIESCCRPYTMNVLLEQNKRDTGAASALMNCVRTGIGAIGMGLIMLPWPNYIFGVGALIVICMAAATVAWVALLHSRIPLACVKDDAPVKPL